MAENIVMPQLGESIAEGTIVKWLKEPGSTVNKDENVVLISTDKVEAEIPSPSAGILLSINVGPGQTVPVGTVLGTVGQADEVKEALPVKETVNKAAAKPAEIIAASESQPIVIEASSTEASDDMRGFLSPLVRRIASEHKLTENDIKNIPGSGRGGRISKDDILSFLAAKQARQPVLETHKEIPIPSSQKTPSSERSIQKPISTMRRVIMENMIASRKISAHVTTFFEIDYTAIDKVRHEHKEKFLAIEQVPLTYTAFLAAAVCQVLKRHPYINASISGDFINFKQDIHLGIAVSLEQPEPGLMVPVIRDADKQNLRGLAQSIADLSNRVRGRKIRPDELSGGTFTITNPGGYGALIGTPIINQPQVAILGVGNIKKQPVILEVDGTDTIAIRRMGLLSLSFDHRLIDGATADIFMADLKKTLETWTSTP
jgi:pyruvate dehydrogenase E2 component (dihydrolipoamide acetyltransferase)